MYDADYFFVANPLNRYTLSQRNALKLSNPDGSVDFCIQAANPGPDKQSNWLPAPNGPLQCPDAALCIGCQRSISAVIARRHLGAAAGRAPHP